MDHSSRNVCRRALGGAQTHSNIRVVPWIIAVLVVLWPHVALTTTLEQELVSQCPNGREIKNAVEAASEASAVNDIDKYELSREAARQLYRCAHTTDDPYLHDWARLVYFQAYWGSFATKSQVNLNGSIVLEGIGELRDGSKYADVRAAASKAYKALDQIFEEIRAQLGPP